MTAAQLISSPDFYRASSLVAGSLSPAKAVERAERKKSLRFLVESIESLAQADFTRFVAADEKPFEKADLPRHLISCRMTHDAIRLGIFEKALAASLPELIPRFRKARKRALKSLIFIESFLEAGLERDKVRRMSDEEQIRYSLERSKRDRARGVEPIYLGSFEKFLDN